MSGRLNKKSKENTKRQGLRVKNMANRKLSKTFLTYNFISPDQQANFPADNLKDLSSPQRHWRSITSSSTDVVLPIDLLTDQTSITIYLDDCNFKTIRLRESSNAVDWNLIAPNTRTINQDPMHGVYRHVEDVTFSSPGRRYLRIDIVSSTGTTDGSNYFRMGSLAIMNNVIELDADTTVEYPYDVTLPSSHIVENRFPTGKTEKIKLGRLQPMVISFALRAGVHQNIKGDGVQEISDLLRDPTETIFLDFNLGESWQAYLVKKSGDLRASLSSPATGTADFGSVLFDVIT